MTINPNVDEEDRWRQAVEDAKAAEYEKWRREMLFRSAGHARAPAADTARTPLPQFSFKAVLSPDPAADHTHNEILEDAMLPKTADEVIAERAKTHGNFSQTATISQLIKNIIRDAPNWSYLATEQREALDHICTKIARIMSNGGQNPDDFIDIGGYARLGELSAHERSDKRQETITLSGDLSGYSATKK